MVKIIKIPMRAIGVNHLKGQRRNGTHYIKESSKLWLKGFYLHLQKHREDLDEIALNLEWPMMLKVEIHYFYLNYMLKSNTRINMKCMDCDAPNKIVIDHLFKFMGKDDYLVKYCSSEKHCATKQDEIVIKIELIKDDVLFH